MMRTARNLDIAVVVSGDGDFASAIRAVQEMGVRVEVISFRGNTSSDLIDVADLFTDIAQIARVEKSGRSGRRVAAEGDLSMTEVPEKETEGAPRRRRGSRGRDERPRAQRVERDGRGADRADRDAARTSSSCPASACRAPPRSEARDRRRGRREAAHCRGVRPMATEPLERGEPSSPPPPRWPRPWPGPTAARTRRWPPSGEPAAVRVRRGRGGVRGAAHGAAAGARLRLGLGQPARRAHLALDAADG